MHSVDEPLHSAEEGKEDGLSRAKNEPVWVDSLDAAEPVRAALGSSTRFALDTEAAGFHRYSDRICLIQLTAGEDTFILDTLAFDAAPVLREGLEDPDRAVLLHGSDYDLRLLHRDLGLRVRNVVDTQVAAALTGEPQTGLSSLLEQYFSIRLSKKFQRADWAHRPLSPEQLAYAASDTRSLDALWAVLRANLESTDRLHWAQEEFALLEEVQWEGDDGEFDPVTRVKGGRKLDPATLEGFRVAWSWRDALARERDRAPFRVAEDRLLLSVASGEISDPRELAQARGISKSIARDEGPALLEAVAAARARPPGEIRPYPRSGSGGWERPSREEEDRFERLKRARNARADELSLDRGLLAPNAALLEIARSAPRSVAELASVPSVKAWQVEAVGEALVRALGSGAGQRNDG